MTRELVIAGHRIADDTDTFIVAEAGNNMQGSVQTCMEMMRQAKNAGATAFKMQM